ncbi:MAG TPA: chemotaxis protein CheW [Myxococcaceae bacterium]|nr:chemotaxis protein CheW [Myxococcaceae bacterium]
MSHTPSNMSAEVTQLLERRAARLSLRPVVDEEDAAAWLAEFPLGDTRFAIPLHSLRAAVPLRWVTPVPLSPPYVIGVLRFEGQILSALSLSSLLGGRGWRQDPAVLLVVEGEDGRRVAIDCEQIPRPVTVPSASVRAAQAQAHGPVSHLVTPDLRAIALLDVPWLLSPQAREAGGEH